MTSPRLSVFLLCNGIPPAQKLCRRLVREHDLFLCADGGANAARAMGLVPDVVIGDLDSITAQTLKAFAASLVLRVARQDNTDMEKALDFCVDQKVKRVTLAGITGGRMDMTLGNLTTVWKYAGRLTISLAGDGWVGFPITGAMRFAAPRGSTVSLLPFGRLRGVTLRGLRYPLHDATIAAGDVAVSNTATSRTFGIRIDHGKALVIVLHEQAMRLA